MGIRYKAGVMVVSLLLAACFETLPARGIPASSGSLETLSLQPESGADSVRVWRDVLFEVDVKAWADSLSAKRKRKKAAKDSITASGSFKDRKTGNPQPVSKTEDVLMVSRDSVPAASSRKRAGIQCRPLLPGKGVPTLPCVLTLPSRTRRAISGNGP